MNKLFNNIAKLCCAVLVAMPFVACQEDELVKPSALMSDPSLTFDAIGAEPQSFTVASDAKWFVDVDADWITVDRVSGEQTQQVSVEVTDNVKDGVMDAPRQGVITIANSRGYSVRTTVYQKGDNYLGVSEMALSAVAALEDGEYAKVKSAQVVALTSEGFVATDESASMYIAYEGTVAVGDNVFIAGEKSTIYGLSALKAGEVNVLSSSEVTYPTAEDLLSVAETSKNVKYVSTEAGLLGHDLKYDAGASVSVVLLDGAVDLNAVNMHNIAVKAYFLGLADGVVTLAVTAIEDKGLNDNLKAYFYDDFSWMKPYLDASGVKVDDSVADNNSSGQAPNLRSSAVLENLLDALLAKGYEDLNPSAKVIYAQKYYWKFGKTSNATTNNNNGMMLPALELQGDELLNVDIDFDWCAHMTGGGNIDKVSIVVELTGKGTFSNGTQVSDPFVTTQEKGHLEWQHATVMAKGVNNTTRFIIRPLEYASVTPDQQRWHLDNIKISDSDIPYSEPVYANVTVSDEVITFDGNPAEGQEFKVSADKDWTLTTDADWFVVNTTEGLAGNEVTIKVTCQPNNDTKLRHGVITLAAADTRKNIHVVQNSGGSDLHPFLSIVGGNSVKISADADIHIAEIQANVEWKAVSDVDWITIPQTKAIVSVSTLTYAVAANDNTESARTGHIVVSSEDGLESVLTVTQKAKSKLLYTAWQFSADDMPGYQDYFGGTAGIVDFAAGNGGKYVPANLKGNGRIEYWQVDKTKYEKEGANDPKRIVGGTGHPYVTGVWPGDYWLFTATDGNEYPAGTKVHLSFLTRVSGTGQKYWLLEYWDGKSWAPATEVKTAKVGESDVTYNQVLGKSNITINVTCKLAATCSTMQFRFTCAANYTAGNKVLSEPNGGTMRIAGAADGTSPILEVIE